MTAREAACSDPEPEEHIRHTEDNNQIVIIAPTQSGAIFYLRMGGETGGGRDEKLQFL